MHNYIMLPLTMLANLTMSTLFTYESRRALNTRYRLYLFNLISFVTTLLMFAISAIGGSFSLYSVLFGFGFGAAIVLYTICQMMALARGPMHITFLIITSSMIIPALSGIFIDGDAPSVPKLIAILFLIVFLFFAAGKQKGAPTPIRRGWLPLCIGAFLGVAAVGIMQKFQQASAHADETALFLASSFLASTVFALVATLLFRREHLAFVAQEEKESRTDSPAWRRALPFLLIAVLCGICTFINHDFNLKLSGRIPSQIFFPLVNGGAVVLNSLVSVFLFRERLSPRQWVGLIGGTVCLIVICIAP